MFDSNRIGGERGIKGRDEIADTQHEVLEFCILEQFGHTHGKGRADHAVAIVGADCHDMQAGHSPSQDYTIAQASRAQKGCPIGGLPVKGYGQRSCDGLDSRREKLPAAHCARRRAGQDDRGGRGGAEVCSIGCGSIERRDLLDGRAAKLHRKKGNVGKGIRPLHSGCTQVITHKAQRHSSRATLAYVYCGCAGSQEQIVLDQLAGDSEATRLSHIQRKRQ